MKQAKEQRVTLKTAKALALKTTGTATGLKKDVGCAFDLYRMELGLLHVQINPDYYSGSGRVSVEIWTGGNGQICMLFDPVTLEQDYDEEELQRRAGSSERPTR